MVRKHTIFIPHEIYTSIMFKELTYLNKLFCYIFTYPEATRLEVPVPQLTLILPGSPSTIFHYSKVEVGKEVWMDKTAHFERIPSYLEEAIFFKLPFEISEENASLLMEVYGFWDVFICTEKDDRLRDPPYNFEQKIDTLGTRDMSLLIFHKRTTRRDRNLITLLPASTEFTGLAILIKKGKYFVNYILN